MRACGLVFLVVAAMIAPALAQPTGPPPRAGESVLVVPFTGDGSDAERAALTEAAVDGVRKSGADVEIAQTSAAELIAINGCVADDTGCLSTIPDALGVDAVVFGKVAGAGDAREVVIVRVSAAGLERQRAAAKEVESGAGALFGVEPEPEVEEPEEPEEPEPGSIREGYTGDLGAGSGVLDREPEAQTTGTAYGQKDTRGLDFSRVERYSWYITAGGGGAVAVGGLFLLLGKVVQSDIDEASTNSVGELERLEDLEGRARVLYGFGNTLAITGLLAAAVGGALIFYQAGPAGEPGADIEPATAVGVSAVAGGAMLTIGGRR